MKLIKAAEEHFYTVKRYRKNYHNIKVEKFFSSWRIQKYFIAISFLE